MKKYLPSSSQLVAILIVLVIGASVYDEPVPKKFAPLFAWAGPFASPLACYTFIATGLAVVFGSTWLLIKYDEWKSEGI